MNPALVMLIEMTDTLAGITPLTPDPLVTFYDSASGERTELSGITMGNWIAKVSNFLVDDLDVNIGTRLRLALPGHWLRYVWLLSCWNTGVVIADHDAEIGLTGPELEAGEDIKLASALAPFGMRFAQAPAGFVDIGVDVLSHSDHFEPFDVPTGTDLAWDVDGEKVSHSQALSQTKSGRSDRILIENNDLVADAKHLLNAVVGGGSLVIVRNGSRQDIENIARQENAVLIS